MRSFDDREIFNRIVIWAMDPWMRYSGSVKREADPFKNKCMEFGFCFERSVRAISSHAEVVI